MRIQRTANAGVLLTLDTITILLDGVCQQVHPYLPTPAEIRSELLENAPDIVAFTHEHQDHFCREYAQSYEKKTLRPVLGPESLPVDYVHKGMVQTGGVTIRPMQSRHIGKAGRTTDHRSYVIAGTECVWFLGDASPLQFQNTTVEPKPHVLIVPYAYVTTSVGWQVVEQLSPHTLVIVHMPLRNDDPAGLWDLVDRNLAGREGLRILIPELGETVEA